MEFGLAELRDATDGFNNELIISERKNITATTEGSSKASHPPSNEVVINEPSARPSSQPTLKEFARKEKVPPKVPGDKVSTKPMTIARSSTSTSSAHERGLPKVVQLSLPRRSK
ncbi:hypothetical protein Fot_35495 [Forsythia ovata]|uniref:Uncharacterized protein n=1 Tax=Forsythia ovata TaxID=205694 RepID=A0ABD1SLP6_9LAMI